MVEFGLKLEDNQVSEWGDFYIRYEKLKKILKTCQAQYKRFKDLEAKDPELAKSMLAQLRSGSLVASAHPSVESLRGGKADAGSGASSPTSAVSMTKQVSVPTVKEEGLVPALSVPPLVPVLLDQASGQVDHDDEGKGRTLSETSLLCEKDDDKDTSQRRPSGSSYGSLAQRPSDIKMRSPSDARSEGSGSITRALLKAASGVTEYFTNPLERQMKDALLQLDTTSKEFELAINQDIQRVNAFYREKLGELEDRLDFLKDSVATSKGYKPRSASIDETSAQVESQQQQHFEDAEIAVPLVPPPRRRSHRRTKSPMEFARSLVSSSNTRASFTASLGLDEDVDDDEEAAPDGSKKGAEKYKNIREAESIQRAIVDQYRTAKLLHNFAILNFTGFVKIVKKHDKTLPNDKGKYKQAIKPEQICDEGRAVEEHAKRLEKYYAVWFCGGNKSEAQAQMLPKKGDSLEMDWSQLRLGYRLGMCTILGLWVCWDCVWGVVAEGSSTIGERTAFPVFRGCGGLLALQWFWGMSTWVWSRYRINYIYLFDFDPRIVESPLKIFNEAVDNTLVFLTSMLLYYKAGAHDIPGDNIPAGVFPFLLVIYTFFQLILPLRTRVPMWVSIWKVMTSPLTSPSFYHGYVGDIFTSLVKVFQDLAWTVLFVFTGDWLISEDLPASTKHLWSKSFLYRHVLIPLLTLLPLWFRFNQCLRRYADSGDRFPHLANAFKYALSQTVTLFGAFHPLYLDLNRNRESNVFQMFWMFAFIGSSLYSFAWDVYMDWGLGLPSYNFLGPRLMYPKKGVYYAIIAVDLVLRFAWVLTLIPPDTGATFALPHYLTAVSMILELYRRTVWGFLRLENEHRSNTAGFRRVGFVPLHFTTGHTHEYKQQRKHKGFSVLLEVVIITVIVVGVSFASVIAAQHATERANVEL